MELPDGSTVFLASNTSLEYHSDFKNTRDIKLDGEAFFDVARDEGHPFKIETQYGNVKVLGTSFNVNTKHNATKVSVNSGLVALENENERIELSANEFGKQ